MIKIISYLASIFIGIFFSFKVVDLTKSLDGSSWHFYQADIYQVGLPVLVFITPILIVFLWYKFK